MKDLLLRYPHALVDALHRELRAAPRAEWGDTRGGVGPGGGGRRDEGGGFLLVGGPPARRRAPPPLGLAELPRRGGATGDPGEFGRGEVGPQRRPQLVEDLERA